MMLGVVLLFDGALLALGNVSRPAALPLGCLLHPSSPFERFHWPADARTWRPFGGEDEMTRPERSRALTASSSPLQVLFVAGLPLIIGPRKTWYFFSRRNKLRGCECPALPSRRVPRSLVADLPSPPPVHHHPRSLSPRPPPRPLSVLLYRRDRARVPEVPFLRDAHRDVWVPQPVRVSLAKPSPPQLKRSGHVPARHTTLT